MRWWENTFKPRLHLRQQVRPCATLTRLRFDSLSDTLINLLKLSK